MRLLLIIRVKSRLERGGRRGAARALGLALALLSGCVDPYEPAVTNSPRTALIVDGTINLSGITTIRLGRGQNLATTEAPPAETGASLLIQDEAGGAYPLAEQAPGTYVSPELHLRPAGRYQLRLRTAAGRQYASDAVAGTLAPPIDKLSWQLENEGVQVYLNARDPAGSTRYYRWTYQETWEFYSAYNSAFEYVNGQIQRRQEDIFHCWASAGSTSILLGNTTKLSEDVVADFPIIKLPLSSTKVRIKYSILVSQYAQTADEYAYWEKLKKNTESIGSLYDPLPTQLTGNVRCLDDAAETVIGYVGASATTERRLFIDSKELPFRSRYETGYEACSADTVLLSNLAFRFSSQLYLPINEVGAGALGRLIGYSASSADCVDCRRRGSNKKPAFWP